MRIRSAAALVALSALSSPALAAEARLQVIYDAADPDAAVVDVYVGDDLLLDDFAFRDATPFVDVPAGVDLNIGVAPGDSDGSDDVIARFPVTLDAGRTYVAVANGVLDPDAFDANPSGRSIGFDIFPRGHVRESINLPWLVNLLVFHGATDAPGVDVRVRGRWFGPLVRGLEYGEFSRNTLVLPRELTIDITPAGAPETVVATFEADLRGLGGGAAVIVASGFLNPSTNQDGAPFALLAVLPDGTVLELGANTPTAELQVIHNAGDPDAAEVDIYVNGDLFLDDFAYRTATPFVEVPAGVELDIAVAPGTSSSADDAVGRFPITLDADARYVAIAGGVLDPDLFAENPSGRDIAFTLYTQDGIRTRSAGGRYVKLIAHHGATDAPAVTIRARRNGRSYRLFRDLAYGDFSSYRWLRAREYQLDVTPASDEETVVASFTADLTALGGGAAVVIASGFLSTDANPGGAGFGLFAVLPDGTVAALPAATAGESDVAITPTASAQDGEPVRRLANAPNPFNPVTRISFDLAASGDVELSIFNVRGQLVRQLIDSPMQAGQHSITFNADGLASGVYYYRLRTGETSQMRKMLLAK